MNFDHQQDNTEGLLKTIIAILGTVLIAGAIITLALAVVTAADVGLPPPWQVGLLALAAFLGFFGDRKPV